MSMYACESVFYCLYTLEPIIFAPEIGIIISVTLHRQTLNASHRPPIALPSTLPAAQHHVNCNDIHHDPDIAGSDLLRLNPIKV